MAVIATTRLRAVSGLAEDVVAFVRDWSDRAARRSAYRRTRAELAVLSDRELDDLGLSRWDIDRVAREAVYGR